MGTVDKRALAKELAQATPLSQAQARAAIDVFVKQIVAAVAKGDKVTIIGFGRFEPCLRNQRKGMVPGTKQQIDIPARYVPVFTPFGDFRGEVSKLPTTTTV